MSEYQENLELKTSSERSFGLLFSSVLILFGLYPLIYGEMLTLWSIAVGVVILLFSIFRPMIFKYPNILWIKIGIALGKIVSPVVLGVVYIFSVVPLGLLFIILKKDLINKSIQIEKDSYWEDREIPVGSMKNQY